MTNKKTDRWEGIDWPKAEVELFRIQKRISTAANRGNHAQIHQLQRLLLNSFSARALAVRKVAQKNRGRRTPGVDGIHSLNTAQMFAMAQQLDINWNPSPLRQVEIPKGNGKFRTLSIRNMHDRATETLIAMALDPQWENRLPPHMYGFRRGRGVHDAVNRVLACIWRKPKWVLDADIASFFDHVDQEHLLNKLDSLPCIRRAVARMLKSGHIEDVDWEASNKGIPQGGALSPLLANILLTGIEEDLTEAFPRTRRINGKKVGPPPFIVIYADDFVVLHEHREVIKEAHTFLKNWLAPRGLHLNSEKTRITHTLTGEVNDPGFDFLGFHFQQWKTGCHQKTPFNSGITTMITPSKKAIQRLKERVSEVVDRYIPHPKRNAEFARRRQQGEPGLQERMINELNPILRGWANHFRYGNSKRVFGKIDNWLYLKLSSWMNRHYRKKMSVEDRNYEFFNGGNPWIFKVRTPASGKSTELIWLRSIVIRRYQSVRASACYYDGDWIGWSRLRGYYPGIPKAWAQAIRKQIAKCAHCGRKIEPGQKLRFAPCPTRDSQEHTVTHHSCVNS